MKELIHIPQTTKQQLASFSSAVRAKQEFYKGLHKTIYQEFAKV